MIIVGIDAHSRSHSAAAIDAQGRLRDSLEVGAGPAGLEQLCEWLALFESPRLVAVENARGYGLALVQRLLLAGEEVVDVPAGLTGDGRRSGRRGKDDEGETHSSSRGSRSAIGSASPAWRQASWMTN